MKIFLPILFCGLFSGVFGQNMPSEMQFSADGHQILMGGHRLTGFYDDTIVRTIYLDFPQSDYWTILKTKIDVMAKMTVDGVVYDSVGVRFKGATSYNNTQNSDKKSFNIQTDFLKNGQNIDGFQTLNLNNSYEDPSFLREVLYQHCIRAFIPAAKSNFVQLFINNQNWGVYPNVQQLNAEYLKEWFLSKKGTNWRADKPSGGPGGGGGGPMWGDGTAAINYLGTDTAQYQKYYQLKSTSKTNPWQDLITTSEALKNVTTANWETTLAPLLDIDRTLWFLACEIAFADDDSYVFKGKMDYFCYWEAETNRMTPLEYDGNSAFFTNGTTWSAFYNESKVNYPLMNKLFAIPELRQRYLAHLRTILDEILINSAIDPVIDGYYNRINTLVQNDPKKLYTYAQFTSGVAALKTWVQTRRNFLLTNTEVMQSAPEISSTAHFSNGTEWKTPAENQETTVRTSISTGVAVDKMELFYATGLVGNFTKIQMFDDGQHDDGAAADQVFGAKIPGYLAGERVRYYVRLTAANTAKSVRFMPIGAEHNVFTYRVTPPAASLKPVVINEIMASNTTTTTDENNQFEDWIELHNPTSQAANIGGFFLTDNLGNLNKWKFPVGTSIAAGAYLIVWADDDQNDGPLHCTFKLSGGGESIFLLDATGQLVDEVNFGQQNTDLGWARIPNAYGDFTVRMPTFGGNNEIVPVSEPILVEKNDFSITPNPSSGWVKCQFLTENLADIHVSDALGRVFFEEKSVNKTTDFDASLWPSGLYFVRSGNMVKRLLIAR